ncbi:MAG: DUF1697 domain-containing protein [Methylobacteriaceae bacterium]|nr:DUF1697 domain-containing protein [Methylobacteriaceae bacterium]MBV9702967.1 DUF1697 domain-containing protein [Methylobacteriaceae bacterium]
METHIALLRGINVAGHRPVAMSELRKLLTDLGFHGVRSLLQSGNLVFRGSAATGADLERLLETQAERRLGLKTDFLVRSTEEWRAIVAGNPFPAEAERDPSHLVVMVLKGMVEEAGVKALRAAITGPEIVSAEGQEAYVYYPAGIGRSRLTNTLIERKLGARGTARNWNTVLRLAALARESGG